MKKRLFLITLPMLLLASCTNSTVETNDARVSVRTVGNHQYLFYHAGYAGGVCHYEDCQYCKAHKEI